VVWSVTPVRPARPDVAGHDHRDQADRPAPASDREHDLIAWLRSEVERRDRELEQAAVERARLEQLVA
jgi:hypothetical protein